MASSLLSEATFNYPSKTLTAINKIFDCPHLTQNKQLQFLIRSHYYFFVLFGRNKGSFISLKKIIITM
jgi:hypothetical protein